MFNASKFLMVTGVSSIASFGLLQLPASANPFSAISDVLNTINSTVRGFDSTVHQADQTVRTIDGTISNLINTLGLQSRNAGNSVSEANTTHEVLSLYQEWYQRLNPTQQEIIGWLVMEYARNQGVSFETIATSEWFLEKTLQEQQLVGSLVFKLSEIINATGNEKNRFLSYAFCVNSGRTNCAP